MKSSYAAAITSCIDGKEGGGGGGGRGEGGREEEREEEKRGRGKGKGRRRERHNCLQNVYIGRHSISSTMV